MDWWRAINMPGPMGRARALTPPMTNQTGVPLEDQRSGTQTSGQLGHHDAAITPSAPVPSRRHDVVWQPILLWAWINPKWRIWKGGEKRKWDEKNKGKSNIVKIWPHLKTLKGLEAKLYRKYQTEYLAMFKFENWNSNSKEKSENSLNFMKWRKSHG